MHVGCILFGLIMDWFLNMNTKAEWAHAQSEVSEASGVSSVSVGMESLVGVVGAIATEAVHDSGLMRGEGMWLARIRNARAHLSRSEARVADCALMQPEWFVGSSISSIALKAKVSQPTVIRFCRSVGCEGLHDFKLKLSSSLHGDSTVQFEAVAQQDNVAQVANKVLGNTASALLTLRQEVDADIIEQVMGLLQNARRVDVFGLGSSAPVADDAQYKLIRSGINAAARTDAYMMSLCASRLGEQDVAFFISRSGQTTELIEAAELAKAQGAMIISMAPVKTTLAKKSNVVIVLNTDEHRQHDKPAMLTRILQMALIDVIAVGLAMRVGFEFRT